MPRRGLSVFDSCLLPSARRLAAAAAVAMFLYGASRNAGGTGGFTAIRRRPGRNSDGDGDRPFDFVCDELRGDFVLASIAAVVAVACAVTAYVDTLQKRNDQTVTLGGVAMGQPSPPAPVAYPAQPPPYGVYGAKQPAGTSS